MDFFCRGVAWTIILAVYFVAFVVPAKAQQGTGQSLLFYPLQADGTEDRTNLGKPVNRSVVKTICCLPIDPLMAAVLHADFATRYYANQLRYTYKLSLFGPPVPTPRGFVAAWSVNASKCDALVGPGFSSIATAMSPLVDVPWLDYTATSIELSDKRAHSTFSRVIPTDSVGAALVVDVLRRFGWKQINILTVDDAYGRSITTGLAEGLGKMGGVIEVSRAISASPSRALVNEILDVMRNAQSRVIFVAMLPGTAAFDFFVERVLELKMTDDTIFIFNEGMCGSAEPGYLKFDGAICATYAVRPSPDVNAFLSSYAARSTIAQENATLAGMGFATGGIDFRGSNVIGGFGHDAMLHLMHALEVWDAATGYPLVTSAGAPAAKAATVFDFLRRIVTTQGLSGPVTLDDNGDRRRANGVLFNVRSGVQVPVASIDNGTVAAWDASGATTRSPVPAVPWQVYMMRTWYSADAVPNGLRFESNSAAAAQRQLSLIIGVTLSVVSFLLVAYVGNRLRKSRNFKKLVNSGLPVTMLVLLIHVADLVLDVFSAYTVGSDPGSSVVFVVFYVILTCVGIVVSVVEIVVLLWYFKSNVDASGELAVDEEIRWSVRIAKVNLLTLGGEDVPVLIIAFAALVQGQGVTSIVLISLIVSAFFAGKKFGMLKDVLVAALERVDPERRRFWRLRDAARFVLFMVRFTGLRGDDLASSIFAPKLHSRSTVEEIDAYVNRLRSSDFDRFTYLRRQVRQIAIRLKSEYVTPNEFFGFVRPMLTFKFEPLEVAAADATDTSSFDGKLRGLPKDRSPGNGGGSGAIDGNPLEVADHRRQRSTSPQRIGTASPETWSLGENDQPPTAAGSERRSPGAQQQWMSTSSNEGPLPLALPPSSANPTVSSSSRSRNTTQRNGGRLPPPVVGGTSPMVSVLPAATTATNSLLLAPHGHHPGVLASRRHENALATLYELASGLDESIRPS